MNTFFTNKYFSFAISHVLLSSSLSLAMEDSSSRLEAVVNYGRHVIFDEPTSAPQAFVQVACDAFGMGPEDIYNKLAYALFVDGFEPSSQEEGEAVSLLSRHGYCGGSLTARLVVDELKKFLAKANYHSIGEEFQSRMASFINILEKSQWQGDLVDAIRAKHPELALLAKMGTTFGGGFDKATKELPIYDLVETTVKQLKTMAIGDAQLLLFGTMTHDTRLLVSRAKNDQWIFRAYDSGGFYDERGQSFSVQEYQVFDIDAINVTEFFTQIYKQKFNVKTLVNPYSLLGGPSAQAAMAFVSIPVQTVASCHFQGIWAAFKDFMIRAPGDTTCQKNLLAVLVDWSHIEREFASALVHEKNFTDRRLDIFAKKKLEYLDARNVFLHKLQRLDNEDALEVLDSYAKICDFLRIAPSFLQLEVADARLKILLAHDTLSRHWLSRYLTEEHLKTTLALSVDAKGLLAQTWEVIERRNKLYRELFFDKLDEHHSISSTRLIWESDRVAMRSALGKAALYDLKARLPLQPDYVTEVGLTRAQIQGCLDHLRHHSEKHSVIMWLPGYRAVLTQAFAYGMFDEIERLIAEMAPELRKDLLLDLSIEVKNVEIMRPSLFDEIIDHLERYPNTELAWSMKEWLVALLEHRKLVIVAGDTAASRELVIEQLFGSRDTLQPFMKKGICESFNLDNFILIELKSLERKRDVSLRFLSVLIEKAKVIIVADDIMASGLGCLDYAADVYERAVFVHTYNDSSNIDWQPLFDLKRKAIVASCNRDVPTFLMGKKKNSADLWQLKTLIATAMAQKD